MNVSYTKRALRDLDKLQPQMRERIVQKIRWYRLQADPLSFAKRLTQPALGMFRFEIGDFRAIFDVSDGTIHVLAIRHRSKAYDDV